MGNSLTTDDKVCTCLDRIENDKWIICDECLKWFHPACTFSSPDEFERLLNNSEKWFCRYCAPNDSISDSPNLNQMCANDDVQKVRNRLPRNCKKSRYEAQSITFVDVPDNFPQDNNSKTDDISDRVTCKCGFIAKNERGLRIHLSKKKKSVRPDLNDVTYTNVLESHQSYGDKSINIDEFNLLLGKCKQFIPVTRIIQKSVGIIVCQELTSLLNEVVSKNDIISWMRLLAFPFLVLNSTNKSNSNGKNYIRSNLENFKKIANIDIALRQLLLKYGNTHYKKSKASDDLLIKTATRKVGEGDIRGAIRVLTSNETIAEANQETKAKLLSKHPDEAEVGNAFVPMEYELKPTQIKEVEEAIRDFPISTSSGIDGLRPRHLKDLTSFTCGESASGLLKAIVSLSNLAKAGKICEEILPIFYGASLIAFDKKKIDVRPIAIGITWRRVAGKIVCYHIKDNQSSVLAPVQLGSGVKGGAEALIHAVRCFATADHNKAMAIIKFDFKNAFNMLFRKLLLSEVAEVYRFCQEID